MRKSLLPVTILLLILILVLLPLPVLSQSVSLDVQPRGFVPARGSAELFNTGAGGSVTATFDPLELLYLKTALGYSYMPTISSNTLSLVTGNIGGGLRVDIGSAATFRLGASAGMYLGFYDNLTAYNPSIAAESSIQFKLGDGFRLGVGGGYEYYVGNLAVGPNFSERAFLEGFNVFVGATFVPGAATGQARRPRLEIGKPEFEQVFPVFYQYYNDQPLGTVTITNRERRPVSNVSVSFLVQQYMEAPKLSLRIDRLAPGESVEVPILALFRDSILSVTEGTTVSSQLIVEYEEGEDFLTTSRNETVRILNRNNLTWDDDRKAAAFVTANDPTVLRFARNIAAAIRGEGGTAVNERLRIGMALFQALSLYGMEYSIDPDSSYIELSKNGDALDLVLFPSQTLDFRAGDCDDLSVLYCSLLESVGVRTAFLTIPGHIFVAFALDMDEAEAARTFSRPEDLIIINKEAWLPVEITMVRQNFLDAWSTGAKQWRDNIRSETAKMLVVRDAWKTFAPTGFSSESLTIALPQTTEVVPNYAALLRRFIEREIAPRVTDLRSRIGTSGGNQRLINSLGTLYARYGLYAEAEKEFLLAIKKSEYLPALVNLGSVYLLRNDLRTAFKYFERARAQRKDDPLVLINLARVHFDLGEYTPATQRFKEAQILAPEVVKDFSYIISASAETGRASSAQQRNIVSWKDE